MILSYEFELSWNIWLKVLEYCKNFLEVLLSKIQSEFNILEKLIEI